MTNKSKMYALADRIDKVLSNEILAAVKAIIRAVTEIDNIAHDLGQIENELKKGDQHAA